MKINFLNIKKLYYIYINIIAYKKIFKINVI